MSLSNPPAADWRMTLRADALCLGGAALGAIGLTGWLTGVEAMVTLVPGQPPMMPNTAFALLLLGTVGAMRVCTSFASVGRSLSVLLAIIVLFIGFLTLAEYALELPFSIDQLAVRSEVGPYPGRPSPPTALALVFLAAGILWWKWRPAEWLTLLAGLIAFTALLGQAFGAGALYRLIPMPITGVAVHTALGLLLISAGLVLERPGSRLARIASSPNPGDTMLRQLALAFILMSVAIGASGALLSEILGRENVAVIAASLTVIGIVVGLSLLAVTARQLNRAHEALEQGRRSASVLIEQASEGVFVSDLEGRFVDVNSVGCRMAGYSREEIVRKTIADLIPPDDLARLRSHRAKLLEGHADVGEWALRRKDGSYLPVEVSAKILPDGRWLAFSRDISERKRAEDALHLSEAKFSGIVSISADAIISIDENQKITLFNEGAEKIFGRSSADVIGSPLDILIPERFRAVHARHVESFASGPDTALRVSARNTEIIGVRSSGEEFPADAAISKLVIGGKPILTVALRDITEQKRAEREQRMVSELGDALAGPLEFEQRLTNIAQLLARDLAEVCIVDVIDDDGSLRRAKVACRDTNKEWLCDVLMRQPPGDTRAGIAKPEIESGKASVIRNVTPNVIGSWARSQEDRAALETAGIQSAIVVPLIARGKALGFVFLLSLSRPFLEADSRIAESVIQRAALVLDNARLFAVANRAIQARDDILGVVAHDLRNPLAAISTLAAVLQATGTDREIGDEIASAAGRMGRMIRDLVDVTLLEARAFTVKQEGVPTRDVLSEVFDSQTHLASSASLELLLDAAHDLPDIWADHDRLLQVFENLVGNAIKFTRPGGRITLGARAGAGEVLFSVADTGCGIESDQLPRVFDRFWQAPEAKRKGAGLGLPIVKGIVEAHGGRIWVQSSPGQGSTFFFTVPTVEPHAAVPTQRSAWLREHPARSQKERLKMAASIAVSARSKQKLARASR
jgi:PAS domain S-box-containing protein